MLGGGLGAGKLHELLGGTARDEASALGLAAMFALALTRADAGDGAAPILWLREEAVQRRAALHGPGLADLGLDPARLILGVLPDPKSLLRSGVDALRCAALGAVILELSGNPPVLDLTATRRLALAAEDSGVTPLLLRLRGARPMPSAAQTRWQVSATLSAALEADAPGHPALILSLLRQRGGAAGLDWTVEWDRDAGSFRPAALPGARLPLSGGGSLPAAGTGSEAGDDAWPIAI
nr:hypothetical protein [Sphingobium nicotianae]